MPKSPWTGLLVVIGGALFKIYAIRAFARYGLKHAKKRYPYA